MKFCRRSCWLFSRFFCAMLAFALFSSSAATCASSFALRSAVSIVAITWPSATRSPSRTSTFCTSPGTFERTVDCSTGESEPESDKVRWSSRISTVAMSAGVNSRTTLASDFVSSFFACDIRRPTRAPAAMTMPATMRNGFTKRRLAALSMDDLWERRARPLDAASGRAGFARFAWSGHRLRGGELYAGGWRAPVTECDWRRCKAWNLRGFPGMRGGSEERFGLGRIGRRLAEKGERPRQRGGRIRRIDRGGARLLGEFLPGAIRGDGDVQVARLGQRKALLQEELPRRGKKEGGAAHDVGDALGGVVHHDRKLG